LNFLLPGNELKRNAILSRPLRAPEKAISTAEYSFSRKRTQKEQRRRHRLGLSSRGCRMETLFQRLCLAMGLPRGECLEGHQEGEDAGACRRDQNQEHEHSQGQEHEHDLGGRRQLLELLQEFFEI
jgi:hypothetical protein